MEWFLIPWLLVNGVWVQGDSFDGWSSIQQPSKEVCLMKLEKAY